MKDKMGRKIKYKRNRKADIDMRLGIYADILQLLNGNIEL